MTVDTAKLRQDLRKFVVDTYLIGDESQKFSDSDSFMRNGIIDSTGVLELTAYIEQTFGFAVEDQEMTPTNLDSIDNLIAYISRKLPK